MNENKSNRGWRILRRLLIGAAVFITLIAIFYTEEDWRGKHAWKTYQHELETKGEILDWDKFIPPPVPDDENFFAAPRMQEWFVGRNRTDFLKQLDNAITRSVSSATNLISVTRAANEYLAWSDQFTTNFDLIRTALKRPYAQMNGDYSQAYQIPIPNFVMVRFLAQTLAQRAHCYLLLHQPEKALDELIFLNDSRRLLLAAPTGQPMTLIAAMINVSVISVYANGIAEGLRQQAWNDVQLRELQRQLQGIELKKYVLDAFRFEQQAMIKTFTGESALQNVELLGSVYGTKTKSSYWQKMKDPFFLFSKFAPRGWVYQNVVFVAKMKERQIETIEAEPISPGKLNVLAKELEEQIPAQVSLTSPFKLLASIAIPNTSKAMQTLAQNQTLANEAQITCALERYKLANGEYPETLDVLTPKLIAELPHDIINGQPLHYRREVNGQFILYSVGWNETDDGGKVVLTKGGSVDRDQGDWVWQYPKDK